MVTATMVTKYSTKHFLHYTIAASLLTPPWSYCKPNYIMKMLSIKDNEFKGLATQDHIIYELYYSSKKFLFGKLWYNTLIYS